MYCRALKWGRSRSGLLVSSSKIASSEGSSTHHGLRMITLTVICSSGFGSASIVYPGGKGTVSVPGSFVLLGGALVALATTPPPSRPAILATIPLRGRAYCCPDDCL